MKDDFYKTPDDIDVQSDKGLDVFTRHVNLLRHCLKENENNKDVLIPKKQQGIFALLNTNKWEQDYSSPLGYRLQSNQDVPKSFYMGIHQKDLYDAEHLQEILRDARMKAVTNNKNLNIDMTHKDFKDYAYMSGLVDEDVALPLSKDDFKHFHYAFNSDCRLADLNRDSVSFSKDGKSIHADPRAKFIVHDYMQDVELRTEAPNKDSFQFIIDDNVRNLGNISYGSSRYYPEGTPDDKKSFDVSFKGSAEAIRNLKAIPAYDERLSENFHPKNTVLEFEHIPVSIPPVELAESLDAMPGDGHKTINLKLDKNSPSYKEDCQYINDLYRESMSINPEHLTLRIYDNYTANGKFVTFDHTSAPGADYDESLSRRPEFNNEQLNNEHEGVENESEHENAEAKKENIQSFTLD